MSWKGRKGTKMIRCRLGPVLANEDWHTLFPCSFTEYLGMVGFDQPPIVAFIEDKVHRKRRQFRFDKRWIGQDGLLDYTGKGWFESRGSNESDIVTRVGNCRHEIAKGRKKISPLMGRIK